MEIEQFFENLMNDASSRKQASLRIINNICNEQILRNSPDFSIATIGKISKLQGGPSEQAIRNKNGEAYRLLITAWSNKSKQKNKSISKPDNFDLLQHIQNPSIRAEVGLLLAEIKQLRGENRILKALNKDKIIIDRSMHIDNHTTSNIEFIPNFTLATAEKHALQQAINPQIIESNGWSIQKNGSILNENGRKIFEAYFVSAIKKVLDSDH